MEASLAHVKQAEFEDEGFNKWKLRWPMSIKLSLTNWVRVIIKPRQSKFTQ